MFTFMQHSYFCLRRFWFDIWIWHTGDTQTDRKQTVGRLPRIRRQRGAPATL